MPQLDFAEDRVLAVVAHPDDAELLCAGTLARARSGGAAIAICVLCRGDKGQPVRAIRDLSKVRHKEATAAAKLLGAELFWLNVPDGELADAPALRRRLVAVYRRFRTTLVLAHCLEDYHPDHRAAGKLAEAATWFSASRGHKTRSASLETPPALWWMDALDMHGFQPDIYVDITAHTGLKQQMLACHQSQLARAGDPGFAPLAAVVERQAAVRGAQAGVAAAEAFALHNTFRRARAW